MYARRVLVRVFEVLVLFVNAMELRAANAQLDVMQQLLILFIAVIKHNFLSYTRTGTVLQYPPIRVLAPFLLLVSVLYIESILVIGLL